LSTSSGASSFRKLSLAIIKVFQIRQVALTGDLNRLDAVVVSRTLENGDSTTFEVGKSIWRRPCANWRLIAFFFAERPTIVANCLPCQPFVLLF